MLSFHLAPLPTIDDTKFFLNTPVSIAAGVTTGVLQIFDARVLPGAPTGLYVGSFGILGGADANALIDQGTVTFAVSVVPEPASTASSGWPCLPWPESGIGGEHPGVRVTAFVQLPAALAYD